MRVRLEQGDPAPGVAHDEVRWLGPTELDAVAWLPADIAPAAAALRHLGTWVDFPARGVSGEGTVTLVAPLRGRRRSASWSTAPRSTRSTTAGRTSRATPGSSPAPPCWTASPGRSTTTAR